MSFLKVVNIQNPSAANVAVSLTTGGNVIIGTNGVTTAPASGNATVVVNGTGTNGGGIELVNSAGGGGLVSGLSSGGVAFSSFTGAVGSETYAERMRIDNLGYVGIGTAIPAYSLQVGGPTNRGIVAVYGTSASSAQLRLDQTANVSGKVYSLFSGSSANGNFDIYDATAAAYRLTVYTNGNVGIGSTTPVAPLDVNGTINTNGTVVMGSSFLRNRIINGAMAVDQRNSGASQTITAGAALAYTADRFYAYCTGANVTGARVSNTTNNPANNTSQYVYQFAGAASVTSIGFGTRIETINCWDLAGTTATLSVNLANGLLTTVTWTASYANSADSFGTLASPTVTQFATGTFTVTSGLSRYSASIPIPIAAVTGIQIVFTVGAQTSQTWQINNVQLEPGTVATPFERRQYGQELLLCQRYYQMSYDIGTVPGTATNLGLYAFGVALNGSTPGPGSIPFRVNMRAAPTISYWDGAGNASKLSYGSAGSQSNNVTPTGAPTQLSTTGFAHPGQTSVGNVTNWIHYAASAEL